MRYILPILLIALLFTSCKQNSNNNTAELSTVNELLSGLSEDTVYVINFWATWCKPCVEELPDFEAFHAKYPNTAKVVLFNLDFPEERESKVLPFIKQHDLQSKVLMLSDSDPNVWMDLVNKDWSGAIPATLIIHKKTQTNIFHEGKMNLQDLEEIIKPIINL